MKVIDTKVTKEFLCEYKSNFEAEKREELNSYILYTFYTYRDNDYEKDLYTFTVTDFKRRYIYIHAPIKNIQEAIVDVILINNNLIFDTESIFLGWMHDDLLTEYCTARIEVKF